MTRYWLIFAFLVVLLSPFGLRLVIGLERDTSRTKGPVRLELRVITPHTEDIQRTFDHAFRDWHEARFGEPVRVVYVTPRGTSDMVRYLRDVAGSRALPSGELDYLGVDVVFGGGDVTFQRELLHLLAPVELPPGVLERAFPSPDLNGVPLYEPPQGGAAPRWVGVVLASFGIAYNPEFHQALAIEPPTTWSDLARPELADLVAHPLWTENNAVSRGRDPKLPPMIRVIHSDRAIEEARAALEGEVDEARKVELQRRIETLEDRRRLVGRIVGDDLLP